MNCFYLVPIVFSVAFLNAAGGFDYSDSKNGNTLKTFAIESKIYLNVHELFEFLDKSKSIVFNFLMVDLCCKTHF